MDRKKINLIIQLAGPVLLVFVLCSINWHETLSILKASHPFYLLAAIFFNFLRLFIEAWRWQFLIQMQGVRYKMKDAFLASLNSIYIGSVTPGDIGNFLKVFYLSEDTGISIGLSLSNAVADKIIDLLILMGLGLWALATLGLHPGLFWGTATFSIFVLLFLFWVIGSEKLHVFFAEKFSSLPKMEKFSENIEKNRADFYKGLKFYKNSAVLIPVAMTLFSFGCFFSQAWLLVRALNIPLSGWHIAQLMAVALMISRVIPVTFSGLGSKDLTLVMLFKNFDATTAQGILFSLMLLFTSYFVTAVVGATTWIIKPIRIGKES